MSHTPPGEAGRCNLICEWVDEIQGLPLEDQQDYMLACINQWYAWKIKKIQEIPLSPHSQSEYRQRVLAVLSNGT